MVFGLLADIRKEIEMTEVIPQVGGVSANPSTKAVLNWLKSQLGKADQVVEEWHDGANFYRKYSSGFIEQGGNIKSVTGGADTAVTFLKGFSSMDYVVTGSINGEARTPYEYCLYTYPDTETGFKYYMRGTNVTNFCWYACGY